MNLGRGSGPYARVVAAAFCSGLAAPGEGRDDLRGCLGLKTLGVLCSLRGEHVPGE